MSDSETDGYVNYSIHSKDIQTARKEIEQFEKILHEAKKNITRIMIIHGIVI